MFHMHSLEVSAQAVIMCAKRFKVFRVCFVLFFFLTPFAFSTLKDITIEIIFLELRRVFFFTSYKLGAIGIINLMK